MQVHVGIALQPAPFDPDACSKCGGKGVVPNEAVNARRHHYMQSVICECIRPKPEASPKRSRFYNGIPSGKHRSQRALQLMEHFGVAPEQDPNYGKE